MIPDSSLLSQIAWFPPFKKVGNIQWHTVLVFYPLMDSTFFSSSFPACKLFCYEQEVCVLQWDWNAVFIYFKYLLSGRIFEGIAFRQWDAVSNLIIMQGTMLETRKIWLVEKKIKTDKSEWEHVPLQKGNMTPWLLPILTPSNLKWIVLTPYRKHWVYIDLSWKMLFPLSLRQSKLKLLHNL